VRQIYDHTDPNLADEWVDAIGRDFADHEMPLEVRWLGRTITKWSAQICAWHRSHVSNGPTDAVNNLAKSTKRVAFEFVNFRHHRVRCLLYAGRPDWTLLPTIQPRNAKSRNTRKRWFRQARCWSGTAVTYRFVRISLLAPVLSARTPQGLESTWSPQRARTRSCRHRQRGASTRPIRHPTASR